MRGVPCDTDARGGPTEHTSAIVLFAEAWPEILGRQIPNNRDACWLGYFGLGTTQTVWLGVILNCESSSCLPKSRAEAIVRSVRSAWKPAARGTCAISIPNMLLMFTALLELKLKNRSGMVLFAATDAWVQIYELNDVKRCIA